MICILLSVFIPGEGNIESVERARGGEGGRRREDKR